MKHTNYILELIIGGLGALTWLFILLITFVDINWSAIFAHVKQENITGLLTIYSMLFLPFVYVTGVVTDRMVDEIFDKLFANRLLDEFFDKKEDYTKAIARIYYKSEPLKENYDYGRMRIRICRVWAFNAFISFIVVNIFLFLTFEEFKELHIYINPNDINVRTLSLYSSLFYITSSLIAFRAWYTLSRKECVVLCAQNEFLLKEESKSQ